LTIKEFLPPILIDWIKKNRLKSFKNYQEAILKCPNEAYQNTELCNLIADKTLIHINKIKERPYRLNATNVFLAFSINYYLNSNSCEGITILDFGGACGIHYYETRSLVPDNVLLKWYVVETPQMVQSAKSRGLNNSDLIFVHSTDEIERKIDFMYSSGALQYVPEPYIETMQLLDTGADIILLNRMMFNKSNRDTVTIQKSSFLENGPGALPKGYSNRTVSYPHTTMSFEKFNSTITNRGYELELAFDETSGTLSMSNNQIFGKGLLYRKVQLQGKVPSN
jgi:putative methyltransferase (TIGR04325 family)